VTPIRPLTRGDLSAVSALYERIARSGADTPVAGLHEQFERTLFRNPQADPEIPSLVYDDPASGIIGFIGSHPRRLRFGGRELRMACSGQLVADPSAGPPGVGALLMRKYLSGPQDLTITDGATDNVRAMWERLGGRASALCSLGWTRILAPAAFGHAMMERRGRSLPSAPGRILDTAARRWVAPRETPAVSEPLGAAALAAAMDGLADEFSLRPVYDEPFAEWLLNEATAVRARGELVARAVSIDGTAAGWYVAYVPLDGIAQVIQLGGPARAVGTVLDRLFADCARAGCAAVQGRLEAPLLAAVRERRCLIRRTEWALIAAEEPAVLAAIAYGDALLTRLDGEWWMGHHL
jgi:hypothetical protein